MLLNESSQVPAVALPIYRVDTHAHLWHYTAEEFDWLDGELQPLRRDFLLDDLRGAMDDAAVTGAVLVQARQTVAETRWLLELAAGDAAVRGVVGWLPLAEEGFQDRYADWIWNPALVGFRHVAQAEPPGFLDGEAFNRGVRTLLPTGSVYEILIYPNQMEEALRFIDRHPDQSFVLDHMAKPRIAAGEMQPWAQHLRDLARRPNLTCKISGLVTEAGASAWTARGLHPYIEVALEAFGADRLMIGTDWPVISVGCDYARWWQMAESWIGPLTKGEQARILGATADNVYGLNRSSLKAGK